MAIRYERAEVIIVGGGIVGCWAALEARRRGLHCILLDQGRPDAMFGIEGGPFSLETAALRSPGVPAYRSLGELLGLPLLRPSSHWVIAPAESPQFGAALQRLEEQSRPYTRLSPPQVAARLPQLRPSQEVWAAVEEAYEGCATALSQAFWSRLRKQEVTCFADTRVERLDVEYDQPTALTADVAFRGRYLWVAGSACLNLLPGFPELKERSLYVSRFPAPAPSPRWPQLPHLSLLFREHTVRVEAEESGFTVARLRSGAIPADAQAESEHEAADLFRQRWLSDNPKAEAVTRLERRAHYAENDEPLVGQHPWRADVVITAALGLEKPWLAPGAASRGVALLQGEFPPRPLGKLGQPA